MNIIFEIFNIKRCKSIPISMTSLTFSLTSKFLTYPGTMLWQEKKSFWWLHQKHKCHKFTGFAVFHARRFVYFLPENFKFQRWIEIGRYQLLIFVFSSFKAKFPKERKKWVRPKNFFWDNIKSDHFMWKINFF